MKNHFPVIIVLCVSLPVMLAGCKKEADATTELEQAVTVLERAPAPAARPPAQTAQPYQPTPAPAQTVAPTPAPKQQMTEAMAAYKAGNLEDAVTRLQKLRSARAVTPEQHIAVNKAIAAVMSEIYPLADQGDARAIQAVKQYERMQMQRH